MIDLLQAILFFGKRGDEWDTPAMSEPHWRQFVNSSVIDTCFCDRKITLGGKPLNFAQKHKSFVESLLLQFLDLQSSEPKYVWDLFGGTGQIALALNEHGVNTLYTESDSVQFNQYVKQMKGIERMWANSLLKEFRLPRILLLPNSVYPFEKPDDTIVASWVNETPNSEGLLLMQGFAWTLLGGTCGTVSVS